ncbi:MAG: hypothetical protein KatS3mg001_004 [Candidatus Pacearchaeota archaeon]|nr:MAG: hypothetical protein KatS3mg001_004 [Candidatus Pacearchaeota archaeon]
MSKLIKKLAITLGTIAGIGGLFVGPSYETGCMQYKGYRVMSDGSVFLVFDKKTYEFANEPKRNFNFKEIKIGSYYNPTIKRYFFGYGNERIIDADECKGKEETNSS